MSENQFIFMTFPLVSILLLNYNGMKYIQNCVESVLKSEYENFELILVDNNSTDDSIGIVTTKFKDPRIKIIRNKTNVAFAAGNNIGAKHANGEYIICLNIDTVVDKRWLAEMIPIMERDKTIGAAQPKLLSLDDKITYDSAGDYTDFYGTFIRRGGDWFEKDEGQYDTIHDIFSARGAALVTRKDIIQKIGLFDECFFMGAEDFDFCWRVRLFGKRVVFIPKSIVYHKGKGISLQEPSVVKTTKVETFVCLMKNYDTYNMIKYAILPLVIPMITGLFLLEPFLFKKQNKLRRIKSKLMTYHWLVTNTQKLRDNRNYIQNDVRKVPDSEVMKLMIKASPWQMLILFRNIIKFGTSKAVMLHFNKGIRNL